MKTKLFYFLALCLALTYISCSDDPSTDESNGTNIIDNDVLENLSEDEKKFVGLWHVSAGGYGHTFIFLPNGKACRDDKAFGLWAYDSTSKVLATTIDMWQFKISAIFEDNWVGQTVNTERGANASRGTESEYFKSYTNMVVWTSTDSLRYYKDPFKNEANSNNYFISEIEYSDITIEGSTFSANCSYYYASRKWPSYTQYDMNGKIYIINAYGDTPEMTIESNVDSDSEFPLRKGTYVGHWK